MFNMRLRFLPFLLALPVLSAPPAPVLQKYAGTWQVTRKSGAGVKEELKNQCVTAGIFYLCQQSSNGAVSSLLVFTPGVQPNHFNTQNVMPDARATGKGELIVDGNKWIFTSTWNGGAMVTHYRTTDTFLSNNDIQFTQEESTDGSHWQLKDSGTEVRATH